ncbi:MAG: hypothetical protein ACLFVJ_20100, partial [Persicimonas sp.]
MSDATCRICGGSYTERGITRHLQSCLEKHAHGAKTGTLLKVSASYDSSYWLRLVASPEATLDSLDQFLRNIWLECCGHMSEFEIGGVRYEPGGGGEGWSFSPPSRSTDGPIRRALPDGAEFSYVYDFGSSTHLEGRSYGSVPWPAELAVDSPESTSKIVVLSRNEAPVFECAVCGEPAQWLCTECQWDDEGFLCAEHARTHDCDSYMLRPVVNSPRMGVCAYDGAADERADYSALREDASEGSSRSGREVVDDLFEMPPVDADELAHRVDQADADDLLAALVDRAERGAIDHDDLGWVMAIFENLGLGDELERLQSIV